MAKRKKKHVDGELVVARLMWLGVAIIVGVYVVWPLVDQIITHVRWI